MKYDTGMVSEVRLFYKYFKQRNIRGMRELSNVFTKDLMVYQDRVYLNLALASLLLAKMVEKPRFWKFDEWKSIVFSVEDMLKKCVELCKVNDTKSVNATFSKIFSMLRKVNRKDKRYVNSMMNHARIKVGATLYAQGMSLGKASYLSGASKNDILKYSGKTLISDRFGKTFSILERIKNVSSIFRT